MSHITDWIVHRMNLLQIDGPAALAEHADLTELTLAEVFQSNCLGALQQSQLRRLGWALQINLKRLDALASGDVTWIDDGDRYLPYAFERPGDEQPVRLPAPSRLEPGIVIGNANVHAPPQGTPVLGKLRSDGRIKSDDCWDEHWGPRLQDGQPQRRDTYALEAPGDGQFLVVRNAQSWEATAGTWVALYLEDDADGMGYFGHLSRCDPGAWALSPGPPGQGEQHCQITIEPVRALRIGRLLRQWS